MRVALTGWTGVIGHAIYQELSSQHTVLTLGRSSSSHYRIDFEKPGQAPDVGKLDAIIHSAGCRDAEFKKDPNWARKKSNGARELVLSLAEKSGASTLVYVSTAHVYGELVGTVDEKTPPAPANAYAECHWETEQWFAQRFSGRVVCLRPNAVYGIPRMWEGFEGGHLIPYAFPAQLMESQTIRLNTSGEQRRNFVSSRDVARVVRKALNQSQWVGPVNPIGPETLSVYEFAQLCVRFFEKRLGKPCSVVRAEGNHPGVSYSYRSRYAQTAKETLGSYLKELWESWPAALSRAS